MDTSKMIEEKVVTGDDPRSFKEPITSTTGVHGAPVLHHQAGDEDGMEGEKKIIDYDGTVASSDTSSIQVSESPGDIIPSDKADSKAAFETPGFVIPSDKADSIATFEKMIVEEEEESESSDFDIAVGIPREELHSKGIEFMEAKDWEKAKSLLEEAIEQNKDYHKEIFLKSNPDLNPDDFPDKVELHPVLGPIYVDLATTLNTLLSHEDAIGGMGYMDKGTEEWSRDAYAHMCLKMASSIFHNRYMKETKSLGDEISEACDEILKIINYDADDDPNQFNFYKNPAHENMFLFLLNKLCKWDQADDFMEDKLEKKDSEGGNEVEDDAKFSKSELFKLIKNDIRRASANCALCEHNSKWEIASLDLCHSLCNAVRVGARNIRCRSLLYDLFFALKYTGKVRLAALVLLFMKKVWTKIVFMDQELYARYGLKYPEDKEMAEMIIEVFSDEREVEAIQGRVIRDTDNLNMDKLKEDAISYSAAEAINNDKKDDTPTDAAAATTQALKNVLGAHFDNSESGTQMGFSKSKLDGEVEILDIQTRPKKNKKRANPVATNETEEESPENQVKKPKK